MHRLLQKLSLVSVILVFLSGCGTKDGTQGALARQSMANQGSVDDLALLLTDHPEVSTASLRDIKVSASTLKKPEGAMKRQSDLNFALAEEKASENLSVGLDPELAKKAQELVDKILGEFAFEAQLSAMLKMMGIAINEAKEMIEAQFKEMEKSSAKGSAGPSKFDAEFAPKEFSCEEIVNNPYLKIPKAEFDRVNKANKKLIKEALSGCPALTAGKFLQCTSDFNTLTAMINEHASCDVPSFEALEKIIDESMEGKFAELQESVGKCMSEEFASCNFKPEELNNTSAEVSKDVTSAGTKKTPVARKHPELEVSMPKNDFDPKWEKIEVPEIEIPDFGADPEPKV